jgi:hypothetical protein
MEIHLFINLINKACQNNKITHYNGVDLILNFYHAIHQHHLLQILNLLMAFGFNNRNFFKEILQNRMQN